MATSWVDIANDAFDRLRSDTISALDDGSTNADLASRYLYKLRDLLIQTYDFVFARSRTTLNQLSTAPAFEWSYAYQLPNDCLDVIQTYPRSDYIVEGDQLLTNESSCSVIYKKQITDPNKIPVTVRMAISSALASALAIPLAKSQAEQQKLEGEAMFWAQRAKADSAIHGKGTASDKAWWTDR